MKRSWPWFQLIDVFEVWRESSSKHEVWVREFWRVPALYYCYRLTKEVGQAGWHFSGKSATRRVVRKMRILFSVWNMVSHSIIKCPLFLAYCNVTVFLFSQPPGCPFCDDSKSRSVFGKLTRLQRWGLRKHTTERQIKRHFLPRSDGSPLRLWHPSPSKKANRPSKTTKTKQNQLKLALRGLAVVCCRSDRLSGD